MKGGRDRVRICGADEAKGTGIVGGSRTCVILTTPAKRLQVALETSHGARSRLPWMRNAAWRF